MEERDRKLSPRVRRGLFSLRFSFYFSIEEYDIQMKRNRTNTAKEELNPKKGMEYIRENLEALKESHKFCNYLC